MAKPFDLSKLRAAHNKKHGVKDGFNDPLTWISTGNYALNKMISGHFDRGVPLGAVTVFAGESGCLPASGTIKAKFNEVEATITVADLRSAFKLNSRIEIDTPDGYQPVVNWFDKGILPMVSLTTQSGRKTACATNHALQRPDETWALASELVIGDAVVTEAGPETISSIVSESPEECFDFEISHDNHRYWGDGFSSHNSGKSFFVSGNIVRHALEMGIIVVLIDTEDALKTTWMENLGVDTEHPNLLKYIKNTVNEIAEVINDFTKTYRTDYLDVPREQQPKILFVIDSLGFLETETSIEQFDKGTLKGDMGIKAKALKMLISNCIRLFAGFEIGLVATNHTYKSQDQFAPDDVISGGGGVIFGASIIISMNKKKLKAEDDKDAKLVKGERKKPKDTIGIIAKTKCIKTRFSKPFEEVEVNIPYDKGMDPYSGLFDMFESRGLFVKAGAYIKYTDKNGVVDSRYRSAMDGAYFDKVMAEFSDTRTENSVDETENLEEKLNVE